MSRRKLTSEERALWESVARKTERLNESDLTSEFRDTKSKEEVPPRRIETEPEPFRPAPFSIGSRSTTSARAPMAPAKASLRMDQKLHGKVKRGRVTPEARIDLHGMTLAEAHAELAGFIALSHQRGLRLVLVITGKGKEREEHGPIPGSRGLIRVQAPIWLRQPHIATRVLEVVPAAQKHGGGGALYVYLKR